MNSLCTLKIKILPRIVLQRVQNPVGGLPSSRPPWIVQVPLISLAHLRSVCVFGALVCEAVQEAERIRFVAALIQRNRV